VEFTASLVSGFARAGYSIWSGGAEGIDGAVHRAALAADAKTVVVAPAGWLRPYPEVHSELFREVVAKGGAYLSLVPEDRAALPHQFFARNALLVALTHATLVVQAPIRSGARNAAKIARRLGRPLFVLPSCPWVHQGAGCNIEIGLGARPVASAKEVMSRLAAGGLCVAVTAINDVAGDAQVQPERDVLADAAVVAPTQTPLRKKTAPGRPTSELPANLEQELGQLYEAVRQGANSVDELCRLTGLSAAVVQSDLLRLTLSGLLRVGRSGGIEIIST
jgi:DNA processing protein